MYFPREVYDQIVDGSFTVEGIPLTSQSSVTKANNLENQIVFVRRPREQPIECLVVRANDLLLKDIKTNRYFRAEHHELEYIHIPEEEGQEVTFALKESGEATLSYLIRGNLSFLFFVSSLHICHNIHKLGNEKLHVKITARQISQIYRGYPEKLKFLSAFRVTRWIPQVRGDPHKLTFFSAFRVTRWIPK